MLRLSPFLLESILVAVFLFPLALSVSTAEANTEVELVEWESEESSERLARSQYKKDFFPLSNHFVSQDNNIVCGPATAAIVLNALRLRQQEGLPVDQSSIASDEMEHFSEGYSPFMEKYTQMNVIKEEVKSRKAIFGEPILMPSKEGDEDPEEKSDFGFQLHQLAELFEAHGANVKMQVVDPQAEDEAMIEEIRDTLIEPGHYVVVNYHRESLGQSPGAGHISPIGAYDQESNSFLVMDVNPYRQPWVWVDAASLIDSMQTYDTIQYRGYLIVSDDENK